MDRSAWQTTVHGVTEWDATEQVSTQTQVQVRKKLFLFVCLFGNQFQGYAGSTCYDQLSDTHEKAKDSVPFVLQMVFLLITINT